MGSERSKAISEEGVFRGFLDQANLLAVGNPFGFDLFETSLNEAPKWDGSFRSHKVGRIAEEAMSTYLRFSQRFDLIAEQIVIKDGKLTKGELDYLIWDKEQKLTVHLELACKFYLYDPSLGDGIAAWIGPNRNDLLKDKLHHIKDHQLPILHENYTQETLEKLGIDAAMVVQRVCLKGFLFTPFGTELDKGMQVDPAAWVGYYYTLKQLQERLDPDAELAIIPKPKWLAHPMAAVSWFLWNEVSIDLTHRLQQKKSTMLWLRKNNDDIERCFVVWW